MQCTRRPATLVAGSVLVALAAGCVSTRLSTVGPFKIAHPPVRRLVVAPFVNLTKTEHAGQIVSAALATEMYKRPGVEVIEASAGEGAVSTEPIERSRAQRLGRERKADAVLFGTVLEYEYVTAAPHRTGHVPSVSIEARLVSAESGALLWAAGLTATHDQLWSFDGVPLEQVLQTTAQMLVMDLEPHLSGTRDARALGPEAAADAAVPADVVHEPPAAAPVPAPGTTPDAPPPALTPDTPAPAAPPTEPEPKPVVPAGTVQAGDSPAVAQPPVAEGGVAPGAAKEPN